MFKILSLIAILTSGSTKSITYSALLEVERHIRTLPKPIDVINNLKQAKVQKEKDLAEYEPKKAEAEENIRKYKKSRHLSKNNQLKAAKAEEEEKLRNIVKKIETTKQELNEINNKLENTTLEKEELKYQTALAPLSKKREELNTKYDQEEKIIHYQNLIDWSNQKLEREPNNSLAKQTLKNVQKKLAKLKQTI